MLQAMCRAHLNSNAEAAPCVRNSGALGFSNMLSVAARVQSHSAVQQHGAARAHVRTHGRYTNEKRNKQKIYVVHKTCFSRRNRTLRSPPEFCCCVRTRVLACISMHKRKTQWSTKWWWWLVYLGKPARTRNTRNVFVMFS